MTLDEIIALHNNQSWEVEDPSNRDQCFDLALGWCDALGVPRETIRHLNASEIWTEPTDLAVQYFNFIPNTPNGVPQRGDIVVFSGKVGHVSVATGKGDTNFFESFDQNWDTTHFNAGKDPNTGLLIPICRFVTHQYNDVLGWLSPKSAVTPQPTPQPVTDQSKYDFGEGFGILEMQAVKSTLHDQANKISSLTESLNNEIANSNQQGNMITDLRQQLADCQNTPVPPQTPPQTPPDWQDQSFTNPIAKLLFQIAKNLG